MFLLLLHLQHLHQAGVLLLQVVQEEDHEVVNDVGFIALSARVHVDGDAWVLQGNPLEPER